MEIIRLAETQFLTFVSFLLFSRAKSHFNLILLLSFFNYFILLFLNLSLIGIKFIGQMKQKQQGPSWKTQSSLMICHTSLSLYESSSFFFLRECMSRVLDIN